MSKINILIDNPKSWFVPFGAELATLLKKRGHKVAIVNDAKRISKGDIAFFLSCEKIVGKTTLAKNRHNIVIHASDVPRGRGFSPMAWQILDGKKEITVSLFEAGESVDSGDVYFRQKLKLEGHELIDEWRSKEAKAIIALALRFVEKYPNVVGEAQRGRSTYMRRRKREDSELDPRKSLASQFELLRIVDNERYPAFFKLRGKTYILKIDKKK